MPDQNETGTPCVFCEIVAGRAPAGVVYEWHDALAFRPLGPVTEGHTLVIPKVHVADFKENPDVTASVMDRAASLAFHYGDCNIITSAGPAATQTVMHLHVHLVPRREGDGLALPWTPHADSSDVGMSDTSRDRGHTDA